ncbi:nucleotidyltransferase domain-containing protein [Virgibacillus halodenitrificans]|uniref:nucleotidyltransferase domain-containing protein n=1 Tax=Virgibacillus halodenitrificans TaxID=1482 RepID=UPI0013710EF6|nr:nucleotidyltransferase domain-containing protein [Virgibacillus halodenitrificans]MYL44102.1 nucleotidyltransferase domain-containing protein [Virgibacillus halodenitrificans]
MLQEDAVEKITESLKADPLVKAVFLKGSMGRGEHDEHSDIDLYCLVDQKDEALFLEKRLMHLKAYQDILFWDDIFIIAPQIIAVYNNLLHLDLFTVTEQSFKQKDYFTVLYDPEGRLDKYKSSQNLRLSEEEFKDDVIDVVWFLFQYKKSASRGNDLWSVAMLQHVMTHMARVLLHHYCPERAQLGLKTITSSVPEQMGSSITAIFESLTPEAHSQAARRIQQLVASEKEWIISVLNLEGKKRVQAFMEKMLTIPL